MARGRRRMEEEHENHERWLVSYADFITLLFAFFVVMYSVSSVNEGKFRVLSDTLVAAFKSSNRSLNPIQVGKIMRSPASDTTTLVKRPVMVDQTLHGKPGSGRAPADSEVQLDPDATGTQAPPAPPPGSGEAAASDAQAKADAAALIDALSAADAKALADALSAAGAAPAGGAEPSGGTKPAAGVPLAEDSPIPADGQPAADAQSPPGAQPPAEMSSTADPQSPGGIPSATDTLSPLDPLADLETVASRVETTMSPLIDKNLVNVRMGESWVEIEFNTSILFASGSARLEPAALSVLADAAEILKALPNPIQVEGYTDNVPISTETFPSNWELSAARAASVVHLFTKAGIRPQRLAAIGYGEYQPAADNDTPEGRRRNRRVVLVIPAEKDARQVIDLQRATVERGRTRGERTRPARRPAQSAPPAPPGQPARSAPSGQPGQSAQPQQSGQPVQSARLVQPAQSTSPAQSPQRGGLVQLVSPVQLVQPVQSLQPLITPPR